ncbi:rRNA maturation RNase YbeY [Candidatus Marinamargulisbacteria bacterium SCGC AG-410-N11]|nr:rRNA maturation RNase YbeY [Candidatus Marinamargulisbacteria bacterium SCGC AG-410-N11]
MSIPISIKLNFEVNFQVNFDIKSFISAVLNKKNICYGSYEFNFVKNETIIAINKQYLNRNYITDIISFNLGTTTHPIGDVYICIDQVKLNAQDYNSSFENEFKLIIVHGILHLLDYKDYSKEERNIMEQEQDRLLKLLSNEI